jgi:hypothetical protein
MKTLILFFSISLLSSCSFFSPNPKDRTYSYLTGKGLKNPTTDEIKTALLRNSSMSGGNYQFNAFPYTYTLIDAMVRETTQLRGLTKDQQQTLKDSLEEKYLLDKTCFNFSYEVTRFEQSSRLQDWSLAIVDKEDQEFATQWSDEDLKKKPVVSKRNVAGDKLNKWLSSGVACTQASPKLASGFGIKVTPKFVQFPFDKSAKLFWEFPEIKIVDGQAQEVEGKKKSFRSYRGW